MTYKFATIAVLTAALVAAPLAPAHAEGWRHGGWGHGGGWGHHGGWGGHGVGLLGGLFHWRRRL